MSAPFWHAYTYVCHVIDCTVITIFCWQTNFKKRHVNCKSRDMQYKWWWSNNIAIVEYYNVW